LWGDFLKFFFKYDDRRDTLLDALKGTAILLVLLGHAIQSNVVAFDDNVIFRVIYSFHMPLFMFISGFIAYGTKKFDNKFLIKKFKSLVVPFVLWYIISYFVQGYHLNVNFKQYVIRCILSPDYGLWFLWVLFLNFCALSLFFRLHKYFKDGAFVIGILLINDIPINSFGFYLMKWYFTFFILGYIIAEHKVLLKSYILKFQIASVILFPLLVIFWQRVQNPLFTPYLLKIPFNHKMNIINFILLCYKYTVPLFGIAFVIFIVNKIRKFKIYKLLCWLGLYTIDIYIFQFYFLKQFHAYPINILLTFSRALLASLLLSFIFRSFKFTRILLLGQSK
jgi:fucose 4-O-acetylase-like acetyltransferase